MRLDLVQSGMVTPVGYQAPSSCAAIRVGLSNFQMTRFELDGDFVRGAAVPLEDVSAWEKHASMAVSSINQCMPSAQPPAPHDTAIALCLAETRRPGRLEGLDERFFAHVCSRVAQPLRLGPHRRLFENGTMGGIEALGWAEQVLEQGAANHVVVVGVDSYLSAPTLKALHAAGRLMTAKNKDGAVPGEAGAAALFSRTSAAPVAIECRGIGWGRESATRGSGLPLRAEGLTQAYRAAFKMAGYGFPDVDYRIADVGGDHYAFKEAALALLRTMRVRKEDFYLWHPADCIGQVGAASVPLILGTALAAARRSYAPGPGALCHFADETGLRAALVLRERDTRDPSSRLPFPQRLE